MAKDDLFDEEEGMVRMTFGEHLEDLRRRLILSLLGVIPATIIGLFIGDELVAKISDPAKAALNRYAERRREQRLDELSAARAAGKSLRREQLLLRLDRSALRRAIAEAIPELQLADAPLGISTDPPPHNPQENRPSEPVEPTTGAVGQGEPSRRGSAMIEIVAEVDHEELEIAAAEEYWRRSMLTLGAQEAFMAYFKVSLVAGIVMASWWIIYHLWQFVAEGLYRHERYIVYRAMPLSVGLFLSGVLFCFFAVLPVVLNFFFGVNEWLKIEPNIRLSEWIGFATILPLIFGLCFELPLVMLVLESVGIFRVEDYLSKWRHAVLIIAIVAMLVTPTTDPGSMMLLMGPMGGLYFLGIGMVQMRRGGLRALSAVAKLRAAVGALAALYLIGISAGFAFPPGWVDQDWWLEIVWKPGTWPTSWLFRKKLENLTMNWLWGVTLANGIVVALVLLRAGELLLRLAKGDAKK